MPKIDAQIAEIETKMEQHRQRLKDLKARATRQERKDDARRKLLYGAAFLATLDSLSGEMRRQSLVRVEARITRPKDREFLGLPPLKEAKDNGLAARRPDPDTTAELPFDEPRPE